MAERGPLEPKVVGSTPTPSESTQKTKIGALPIF